MDSFSQMIHSNCLEEFSWYSAFFLREFFDGVIFVGRNCVVGDYIRVQLSRR